MSQQYSSGHCAQCQEVRKLERKGTNHLLHFFISLFTAGLWLIVWIGTAIKFGGWRCSTCGTTSVKKLG